jgi:hypothetical protein
MRAFRPLFSLACVAALLAATIGIPLPQTSSRDGAPYPCQHHACGCRTAEKCWRSCCCFSSAEKLAWARRNNIEPPAYAVVGGQNSHESESTHVAKHCCTKREGLSEHSHQVISDHDEAESTSLTFISGPLYRECSGLAPLWSILSAALPPPSSVDWTYDWLLVETISSAECSLESTAFLPAVPPPRA